MNTQKIKLPILLFLNLLPLLVGCDKSTQPSIRQSERILYVASGQLRIMDIDGNNDTPLSTASGNANPQPSLDGSKILFESTRHGDIELYIIDPDGRNEKRLTNNPRVDFCAVFFPHIPRILYSSEDDSLWIQLYSINLDGSNKTQMTNVFPTVGPSAFSPDGSLITFRANSNIYLMNSDGTEQHRLSDSTISAVRPKFSPDGTKVFFVRSAPIPPRQLGYVTLSDTTFREISPDSLMVESYEFTPDGQNIVFTAVAPSSPLQSDIWTMKSDGTVLTNLTKSAEVDFEPKVSAAGDKIVWYAVGNNSVIKIMASDGSNKITLSKSNTVNTSPVFFKK